MNIQKMMQQAQQLQARMQEEMERAQEKLAAERLEGTAGGDLVKVVVNGHKQLVSVQIKPQASDPDDPQMLEDLVFTAMQTALSAAEARAGEVMAEAQGGMGLPAGMDLGGLMGGR
jgi:DNA-binding YbaB/EbfC family protein